MATITLQVNGTSVGNFSTTTTLGKEESDRFMTYLVAQYGEDEDGNARTPQQIIDAAWAAIRTGMFSNVKRYEQDIAAQAARDDVPDMTVS